VSIKIFSGLAVCALRHELLFVHALRALLVGPGDEDAKHGRIGGTGKDGVDPDLVLGEPLGERPDEAHGAELHRGVDRAELRADQARGRGGIEQAAAAAHPELGQGRLGGDDLRAQVESTASAKSAISMPSTEAGPGWPRWFQTKSRPPKALAVSHDPSRVGIFPEVGDDALGLAAVGRDLLHDRMHAGLVDVDHGDARALAESLLKPLYMAAKQA
jgi:hypothetical protein